MFQNAFPGEKVRRQVRGGACAEPRQDKEVRYYRGEGATSLICGDFSVALRGVLRFVFNFELYQ